MHRPYHRAVGLRKSKSCIIMPCCFFCCRESAQEGHPEVDVSGSLASKLSMEYEPDERPGTGNKGSNHDPGIYGVLFPS